MVIPNDLRQALALLEETKAVEVVWQEVSLFIHIVGDGDLFMLSSPVYQGTDFIPKKVRESLKGPPPFVSEKAKTNIDIDEDQFAVRLSYLGKLEDLHNSSVLTSLDGFTSMVKKWRRYLDEQDRDDRVYSYRN